MKKAILHIMSLFTLVVFLFASTGVGIYHHYCSAQDLAEASLYVESFSCSHHNETDTEILNGNNSCCSSHCTDHETDNKVLSVNESDCCETTLEIVRLDDIEFIQSEKPVINSSPIFSETVIFGFYEPKQNLLLEPTGYYVESPPPLLYGKDFLHFIQSLKMDSPA